MNEPYATPRDPDFRPNAAELADWTARNKATRDAYATRDAELDAKQLRNWKRFGRWPAPGERGLPK